MISAIVHHPTWKKALAGLGLICALAASSRLSAETALQIDTRFPGASLGAVETIGPTHLRLYLAGQVDENGRNRQPTWFYFRLSGCGGKTVTLTFAGFGGEYDGRPVPARIGTSYRPVWSEDGETWKHAEKTVWDAQAKELTVTLTPRGDELWMAYLHPYSLERIHRLVGDAQRSPYARVDEIGQSVQGRPLQVITITDPSRPDEKKAHLWLIARQHAWETGTSFVWEGALAFLLSGDPEARRLRQTAVFSLVSVMDPDGCASGAVRFNANGYDLNRHWRSVDVEDAQWRQAMPEIWHVKRALRESHRRHPIDLLINLHNNDTNEYLATNASGGAALHRMQRFFRTLADETNFDPSRPDVTISPPVHPALSTTNSLWDEFGIPTLLVEQRIGPSAELGGRRPTPEDRREFGRGLVKVAAAVVEETRQ